MKNIIVSRIHNKLLDYLLSRKIQNKFQLHEIFENKKYISCNDIKKMIYIQKIMQPSINILNPKEADFAIVWNGQYFYHRFMLLTEALKYNLPILILEDGFIRSIDIAAKGSPGLSCVFDRYGMHFIPGKNELHLLLNSAWEIKEEEKKYAKFLINKIIKNKISKYNFVAPKKLKIGNSESKVLVIDQRANDQSVLASKGNTGIFKKMLKDAINENPDSDIIIKTHPDANSNIYSGYFVDLDIGNFKNIYKITEDINPITLLNYVDKVYVFSSQMGFEALMCNKKVVCYGSPFYSGWGVTDDRNLLKHCKKERSVEEIFYAAYIIYSKYYHPIKHKSCTLEELLEYFIENLNWKNDGD